uniref:MYND-type domain-containing protein n=1 Tax=Tetradesmus obliquus TaxID=3088 RepID=A0A383WDM2_TETOB|eukprot:jgi/Sobl393_1/2263/SZX75360.1
MVSAGTLLTWVLQRPELITTDRPTVPGSRLLAALYHESHRCLAMTVIAIVGVGRSGSSSSSSSSSSSVVVVEAAGSVGTLAAAMTQQLEQSGLLPALPAVLQAAPKMAAQRRQQQQQQQQQPGDWRVFVSLLDLLLQSLMQMWRSVAQHNPAMLRTVLPSALPLLQHLQAAGRLLPSAAINTAAAASGAFRHTAVSSSKGPHEALFEVQFEAARMLCELGESTKLVDRQELERGSMLQLECTRKLLADPAASELLLQLLAAHTHVLHSNHVTHRQQQRQGPSKASHGSSSSSSSSSSVMRVQEAGNGPKQQLRADLLPIPSFHQHPDMLQQLPGGQAYLDAAVGCMTTIPPSDYCLADTLQVVMYRTRICLQAMTHSVQCLLGATHAGQALVISGEVVVLSAAAVRLVLELQLLAAALMQRQHAASQQQQRQGGALNAGEALLLQTTQMLHLQIRAVLQVTGSSSLPPELLQQAGLQLLQALAAPLHQLQLCYPGRLLAGLAPHWGTVVGQQLLAFRAAGAGMPVMRVGVHASVVPQGQLPALAAAHPEAYSAVLDCFLRSPLAEPLTMFLAADMFVHPLAAVLGSQELLGRSVAVASLVSALTSLVKRAVQFTQAAASMQQAAAPWPADAASGEGCERTAAICYPAFVTSLVDCILSAAASGVWKAATAISKASSSSSSSSSQAAASVALLAVVLARCVVQLADAMEAAGPQLLFQALGAKPGYHMTWVPCGMEQRIELVQLFSDCEGITEKLQWQFWQLGVLGAVQPLLLGLQALGSVGAPGCGGQLQAVETEAAAAAAGPNEASSSSSNSSNVPTSATCGSSTSSSSSGQQVKWSHLLHLQQSSPECAAALAAFCGKWPMWWEELVPDSYAHATGSNAVLEPTIKQQFADAIELCRALVAAAPLPVVCNNPSCESFSATSEAAASCKACAGCGCRYCSVACQKADRKRHRGACKRMAAAG